MLLGDIVEVEPGSIACRHDALGPQHRAVLPAVQLGQDALQLLRRKGAGGFHAPAGEHLVGVVAVVVMVVSVAVSVPVVLMAVVMRMAALMLLVVVVMVMAAFMLLVVVVMVMAALMLLVVVVMMVAASMLSMPAVVMMMPSAADRAGILFLLRHQLLRQGIAILHGGQELRPGELVPGGGDDGGLFVLLPQQGRRRFQLLPVQLLGAAENDSSGVLDLVGVELAEVFQIDLRLAGVGHSDRAAQGHVRRPLRHVLNRPDHVGQLAYAGGLDEDAVGVELGHHLLQRLAEVAHQGAADAAGIHFGDLNPRILEEAAVDADLAELVLDEDDLLALEGLVQQLFDQRGLARAQEAGDYVYLCHGGYASFLKYYRTYHNLFFKKSKGELDKNQTGNILAPAHIRSCTNRRRHVS